MTPTKPQLRKIRMLITKAMRLAIIALAVVFIIVVVVPVNLSAGNYVKLHPERWLDAWSFVLMFMIVPALIILSQVINFDKPKISIYG